MRTIKTIPLECKSCSKPFDKELKEYKRQVKHGKTNFFCSRRCTGLHNSSNLPDPVRAGTRIISDGFKSYTRLDDYRHDRVVQGSGINAGVNMPIVHKLFSNVKVWLNGTYHGVSTKHLPRYLREWSYRFNRRGRIDELDHFLLRRAVTKRTITYAELVAGRMIDGAT